MTPEARRQWPRPTYTSDEVRTHREEYREYKRKMKSGWENLPYNEFLDLVKDRPDPSLNVKEPICPSCGSKDVENHGGWATCLGGFGGHDPNHHWDSCHCRSCQFRFTMEYKNTYPYGTNVWYTVKTKTGSKLLRGLPSCSESYIHTCKLCDGDVFREYYDTRNNSKTTILSYGPKGEPYYEIYYECSNCGVKVKCSNDYYREESPHRPYKPRGPDKHASRFLPVIYEETGIVILSEHATRKIEF